MLAIVLKSLTELIGILVIISQFVSLFSNKIVEYFPFVSKYAYLLQGGAILLLLAIYIHYNIKDNSIDIQYRIAQKPINFDLNMVDIKSNSGAQINFAIELENVEGGWVKFLSRLNFNLLVEINHPLGITIIMERANSDFKAIEPKKARKLEVGAPLQLDGRRKFTLYAELDENTSFDGNGLISAKIYIVPRLSVLRTIFPIELGMSKIYIPPS